MSEIDVHAARALPIIAPHRIGAMILRHWYLLTSSWPRLLELIYWPVLQLITWGFSQAYISQNAGFFARAAGVFIGSVLLWDILFRGQLGFSISFLEEMYARNLGNIMMSPLRPVEFLLALMIWRHLIRRDKERAEREAFDRLKAELTRAFAAPEESYRPLSAADVIGRFRDDRGA